ncbi:type 1 glutamine amidotransferase domain-containing protein [Haematococcus lacustris]|uniref:Type 1 glutamine amidotransferase domain-containing protein n=1 Tax=Haematococcus lacustris TaxID=44745 RepID=A0A6A0A8V0_HAELA|nr:type 1 glutamine amidotransferase domain-containing protein [Haematococcus lacustris]
MSKKILVIATSADKLSDGKETGCWMEEVAAPYFVFTENGYEVTIASIKGGEIPFDEECGEGWRQASRGMLVQLVTESKALADVNVLDYDAVFLPGGHGTVVDFPGSEALAQALGSMKAGLGVVSGRSYSVGH